MVLKNAQEKLQDAQRAVIKKQENVNQTSNFVITIKIIVPKLIQIRRPTWEVPARLNRRRIKMAQSAIFFSRFVTDNHLTRHALRAVLHHFASKMRNMQHLHHL